MGKKIKAILVILLIGGFLLSFLFPLVMLVRSSIPAYKVSQELEEVFSKKYLAGVEGDSSLTIQKLSFYSDPTETEIAELLDYALYNHTDEYIDFPNTAYGVQVFTPDESSQQWIEIQPIASFGNEKTTVPPRTEKQETRLGNTFFLLYSDYGLLPEKLRFCVFGIGRTTGKKYVDCLDVLREK